MFLPFVHDASQKVLRVGKAACFLVSLFCNTDRMAFTGIGQELICPSLLSTAHARHQKYSTAYAILSRVTINLLLPCGPKGHISTRCSLELQGQMISSTQASRNQRIKETFRHSRLAIRMQLKLTGQRQRGEPTWVLCRGCSVRLHDIGRICTTSGPRTDWPRCHSCCGS